MCLLLIARRQFSGFPFLLTFNRDEYFNRPTRTVHWWEDSPSICGGRDRERGGTWLGMTKAGHLAALSFVRQGEARISPRSRGKLVADFLRSPGPPDDYIQQLKNDPAGLLGFNLVVGHIERELLHFSNVTGETTDISNGIWGLSNATINTPWPKVERGKSALAKLLAEGEPASDQLLNLMADRTFSPIGELPDTGISTEREHALSPIFISLPKQGYGTRSTTVILLNEKRTVDFIERTFEASGHQEHTESVQWTLQTS